MTVEKRIVLVGIRFDNHARELLDWALVKVANTGDQVVAIHVSRNSDCTLKDKPLLDEYLQDYGGLCNQKEVELRGQVLRGSSIRKVLVREAKSCGAVAVIVGTSMHNAIGGWLSIAKYCAKKLPATTEVVAIDNGKVAFRRCSDNQLSGLSGDPKPSFYLDGNHNPKDNQSEFGESDKSEIGNLSHEVIQGLENVHKDDDFSPLEKKRHKKAFSSVSFLMEELGPQRPGWPLLRAATLLTPAAMEARKMSVVQWVMSLPSRSLPDTPRSDSSVSSSNTENSLGSDSDTFTNKSDKSNMDELLLRTDSSGIKWFTFDVLSNLTSQFSSENLIGRGGCNRVYKGLLPDGKPVAVKILKFTKEAWKDFTLEVEIMTTLNHKNITPLLGICVEDNYLISVYDFMPNGNLEENLHGNNKDKSVLSWDVRFKVAVGIAEALNYLHNECSQPVIHRDVKSSNILLSDEYQSQLTDFGLAIWGPTTSSFLTHRDVVGTFGYLAPEYFMYGKVSEKIDVYSFGVVLLELLSGKKSIGFETPKGQESLVMWAKPKLESRDLSSILDPNMDKNADKAQIQRVGLAAMMCLTQAARLRPKISQILKILAGENDGEKGVNIEDQNDLENQENNDDEVYPDSSAESHLGLALLDVDSETTSFSSRLSLEDYFKGRWSRSSSLT